MLGPRVPWKQRGGSRTAELALGLECSTRFTKVLKSVVKLGGGRSAAKDQILHPDHLRSGFATASSSKRKNPSARPARFLDWIIGCDLVLLTALHRAEGLRPSSGVRVSEFDAVRHCSGANVVCGNIVRLV